MNQKTRNILRWIAVLPGALVAGFLATFPLHLVLYFSLAHGETISGVNINPIEHLLYPSIIAITFVLTGFYIAPKYKFRTSLVLTILYIAFFIGIFIFASVFTPELQPTFGLRGILSLSGSLLGLYVAWTWKKSEKLSTVNIIS